MTLIVDDKTFDSEVLQSSTPVLVDFFADWCGPCKALAPTIDEISGELSGRVKVVKVNIDSSPETPSNYGVRSIPTLILFKEGRKVDIKIGASDKGELIDWIDSHCE